MRDRINNLIKRLKNKIKDNRKTFMVYLILRVLVIICLIREFLLGNYMNAGLCILSLILFLVPAFFEEKFNELLGDKFELVKKDDVISRKMFGNGIPTDRFESCIGDYLAVAKGDFCMRDNKNGPIFKSIHGGDSEEEVKIPLIVVESV